MIRVNQRLYNGCFGLAVWNHSPLQKGWAQRHISSSWNNHPKPWVNQCLTRTSSQKISGTGYDLRSRQPQVLLMAHAKIQQWECQTKVLHPHLTQPKAETLAMAYCDLPTKPSANMYTSAMYLHTSAHKATCRHSDCRLVDQERGQTRTRMSCRAHPGFSIPVKSMIVEGTYRVAL